MNNKKNIVLFSNTLWFFEKFKFELIENLNNKYNVYCLFLKDGPPLDLARINKLKKKGVQFQSLTFYVAVKLITRINFNLGLNYKPSLNPDKVVVFTIGPILLSGFIFFKYRKVTTYVLEGLGRVFVSRKIIYRFLKRLVVAFYKILFSGCNSVITLNYSDAIYLAEMNISTIDKIKVIPGTGIDVGLINNRISSGEFNPKYIDFMARLIAEKGIYKFVYLRLNLLKYYPHIANQYKFRIITPQSDINLISNSEKKYLNSLGIILKPYIDDPFQYYVSSKVIVVPTNYGEGISRVALEAAYIGIPLLLSKNRGTEDIFPINYKYFIKSDNPNIITLQLVDILKDQKYFEKINPEIKNLIESRYTTNESIKAFNFSI